MTNPRHCELIERAAKAGVTAVSTEFFCLEQRSYKKLKDRYDVISRAVGFDILAFYKRYSSGAGYLRLNRNVKRGYVDEMDEACQRLGLRFYVSDNHFKERCNNSSCCGLSSAWNYSRGHFTQALLIAKEEGILSWDAIEPHLGYAGTFLWRNAQGYNQSTTEQRGKFHLFTMKDYLHFLWNTPKAQNSPYRMFEGILRPDRLDEHVNVVYVYDEEKA
jgi:hypothetical protein